MAAERKGKTREGNEIEFSRIVAFSDGVFSIAITLLVLGLEIPKHLADGDIASALWDQHENLVAYAISFAVIGRFWVVHHRFFGEVIAFDARLIALNLLYLAWIVLIPFSSQVLGEYGGTTPAVVLYAANLTGVILIGMWQVVDARRAGMTSMSAASHREQRLRAIYIATIFAASIPVAFVTPSFAPLMWLALFFDPAHRFAAADA